MSPENSIMTNEKHPVYPVPAVRAFVVNPEGKILLLRRHGSKYASGKWCLPGGKVDYNDSPETTIIKELLEETGITIQEPRFLFYQNSPPEKPGLMHCINFYFEVHASTTSVTLDRESSDFEWVSVKDALAREIVFRGSEALEKYTKEFPGLSKA
jgi:8-oxo-dGTP diphosphatase